MSTPKPQASMGNCQKCNTNIPTASTPPEYLPCHGQVSTDLDPPGNSGDLPEVTGSKRQSRSSWDQQAPDKRTKLQNSTRSRQESKLAAAKGAILPSQEPPQCSVTKGCSHADVYHLLPSSMSDKDFTGLERAWGFPQKALRFHVHQNPIYLNPVLCHALDTGAVALLPTWEEFIPLFIHLIHVTTARPKPPKSTISDSYMNLTRPFKYNILHLLPGDPPPQITQESTVHGPLFSDLTIIESDMEPHFAIYNLCKNIQIDDHQHIIARLPDQLKKNLITVVKLYRAWMAVAQPTAPRPKVRPSTQFRHRENRSQGSAIRPRDSVSQIGGSGESGGDEDGSAEERWVSTRKRILKWIEDTTTSTLLPRGDAEDWYGVPTAQRARSI